MYVCFYYYLLLRGVIINLQNAQRPRLAHLQSAGVGIDLGQDVDEEGEDEQQRVEDGHALEQKDGRRLGLVFAQHEERGDVAGQSEHADNADDDRADDELVQQTSGVVRRRRRRVRLGLLHERRESHVLVVGATGRHRHAVDRARKRANETTTFGVSFVPAGGERGGIHGHERRRRTTGT